MPNPNEVSASNSHAVLISELTDTRRHLWTLIAEAKKVAHLIPNRERSLFLEKVIEAEKHLTH